MTDPGKPDAAAERARWAASGAAWDRWADSMADPADRVNRPLLDLCGVTAGDRLLDLASGAGEPALTAATLAGPSGLVVASDLVEPMLAGARRRAAANGAHLAFSLADMTSLPFGARSFDRVTCRFGLMFVPDDRAAVAEMARVLRPGGRAAVAVWGPLEGNTLFRELAAVLDGHLGPGALAGLDVLFRHSGAGFLAEVLESGGLDGVEVRHLRLSQGVPADRPFWKATLDMAFSPALATLSPSGREALEARIAAHFAGLADGRGLVPVDMHVVLGAGAAR